VLHVSRDGIWAFAETADANGWVQLRDIGYIDDAQAAKRMGKPLLVIVKDFSVFRESVGQVAQPARFGTLLPIVGEDKDCFVVSVATASGSREAREVSIRLPKDVAKRFPLELGRENIALVGNALIGIPYGWGELYQGRDCSALLRDFFMPFGIRLPRGSYNQITSGRKILLSGLTPVEKERTIRENGVPFLTLLHLRGHIMLYVGSMNERPLIFHALWGVNVRRGDGRIVKQVVGKSIISTLMPGSELPPATGTLLEKVGSMLILTDRCAAPAPQVPPARETVLELPLDNGSGSP
jgi:NlpC/P60 family protein